MLYNFGKREGNVQSARDTLDATGFNYKTTADGVILGVKQAYFTYLGLRALVKVQEDTVKLASCSHGPSRCLMTSEPGQGLMLRGPNLICILQ